MSPCVRRCAALAPGSSPSEPRYDFQFFFRYSPVSAILIGTTTDLRFLLAGFGCSYVAGFGPVCRFLIPANSCRWPCYCTRDNIRRHLYPPIRCLDSRCGRRPPDQDGPATCDQPPLHVSPLSNGFTSAVKSRIDNNVFHAGFSILK